MEFTDDDGSSSFFFLSLAEFSANDILRGQTACDDDDGSSSFFFLW
jgi:hypothetical protein